MKTSTQAAYVRGGCPKGFMQNFYFNYIPFGLRRWGPFINLQYNIFANVSDPTSDFYKPFDFAEYQLGLTFELLFFHKFTLPLSISYGANVLSREDQDTLDPLSVFWLSTQKDF
ncbi:MAG: hypothetical protein R2827_12280 [Bdellovibrionales bacterium]